MARAFGTELSEYLPAAGAAAVAAVYLGAAYQYSPEARAAPLLIGWTVIVLAAARHRVAHADRRRACAVRAGSIR